MKDKNYENFKRRMRNIDLKNAQNYLSLAKRTNDTEIKLRCMKAYHRIMNDLNK